MEKNSFWEINWFQLRDNNLLRLKYNTLNTLIIQSIKKAGNLNRLTKTLNLSYPSFSYALKKDKMVSVRKLKKLADYLNIDYEFFNNKISEIRKGKTASIKNPKFPFNLNNKEGAFLLGNIVSDGTIYIDKKARNILRTKYSSNDKESINKFINCIQKIFGEVHTSKDRIRGNVYLRIGSSIIGDSLIRVGAHLGNKTENNLKLPKLIEEKRYLQKYYLQAIFDDEGSVAGSKHYAPYLVLTRCNRLKIDKKTKRILDLTFKSISKEHKFPTGHIIKTIQFRKFKRLFPKISDKISKSGIPKLLLGESKILKNLDIDNRIWINKISKTQLGNYSLGVNLFISKKRSILKFYKLVNFSLNRKKNKLENALKEVGWI